MSHVPSPLQIAMVPLRSLTCQLCGVTFGVPLEYFLHAAAYGRAICCPEGHVRRVVGNDAMQQRVTQLEELVAVHGEQLIRAQAENSKLRATVVDRLVGPGTAPEAT